MLQEIKNQLVELKERKKIKILLAVESGSRAWGFPSPDSDYDVRIIYMHDPDWYLTINDKKDTIDYFHGELLDVNGWDIRKTLRLLRKSNATPFEWAQSPIIYEEEKGFREKLLALANQFFQPRHTLNHYMGIARNSYFSKDLKLKKLFYVIRPVLAARWIIEKQSVPPMDIHNLMEVIKDDPVKIKIEDLIQIKSKANEDFVYSIEEDIKVFIEAQFEFIENNKLEEKQALPDAAPLNNYFKALLNNF